MPKKRRQMVQEARKNMNKIIEKKILPEYFDAVFYGDKKFEIRKDEDDIQVGDILRLWEWDGYKRTGGAIDKKVSYVLRDKPEYGLQRGYCIIGWR